MKNEKEINTSYGKVRNISNIQLKKTKLYKTAALSISAMSLAVLLAITSSGCKRKNVSSIPKGQVKTTISVVAESGETVSDIADRFYTDECEGVYNSLSNYQAEIKEQNDINPYSSFINSGQVIQVPVIVDKDNSYYLAVTQIQNEITNIEKNNLWVRYTVKAGDRVSTIAELASGDDQETYEITGYIISKNNISNGHTIIEGEELWIMNPELGRLKSELKVAEEQFKQSLVKEQIKK